MITWTKFWKNKQTWSVTCSNTMQTWAKDWWNSLHSSGEAVFRLNIEQVSGDLGWCGRAVRSADEFCASTVIYCAKWPLWDFIFWSVHSCNILAFLKLMQQRLKLHRNIKIGFIEQPGRKMLTFCTKLRSESMKLLWLLRRRCSKAYDSMLLSFPFVSQWSPVEQY